MPSTENEFFVQIKAAEISAKNGLRQSVEKVMMMKPTARMNSPWEDSRTLRMRGRLWENLASFVEINENKMRF